MRSSIRDWMVRSPQRVPMSCRRWPTISSLLAKFPAAGNFSGNFVKSWTRVLADPGTRRNDPSCRQLNARLHLDYAHAVVTLKEIGRVSCLSDRSHCGLLYKTDADRTRGT